MNLRLIRNKYAFILTNLLIFNLTFLNSCSDNLNDYDASGSFEAIERTISAEATGKILSFDIEEGQLLKAGDTIGRIDVSGLAIKKAEMESVIKSINQKTDNASAQIIVLKSQYKSQENRLEITEQELYNINKEVARFTKLAKANAIPKKQLDDLVAKQSLAQKQVEMTKTQLEVINAQIKSAKKNTSSRNRAILSEIEPSEKRLELIKKQIDDGLIINEFNGTVTLKMAYDGEFTAVGKPLYRIADLSDITLRAYITGNLLPRVKLNQKVIVRTDDGKGDFYEAKGLVTWISSKAEFTPKTIQTKDERANLVYAIKVKVKNDGRYKIGMYGEIKLINN